MIEPRSSFYRSVRGLEYTLFPLTPALSPRQRVNRATVLGGSSRGSCRTGIEQNENESSDAIPSP